MHLSIPVKQFEAVAQLANSQRGVMQNRRYAVPNNGSGESQWSITLCDAGRLYCRNEGIHHAFALRPIEDAGLLLPWRYMTPHFGGFNTNDLISDYVLHFPANELTKFATSIFHKAFIWMYDFHLWGASVRKIIFLAINLYYFSLKAEIRFSVLGMF